jgi:hypothetical protein
MQRTIERIQIQVTLLVGERFSIQPDSVSAPFKKYAAEFVRGAIDNGGIWSGTVFHPWHNIATVTWTTETIELPANSSSFLGD